MFGELQRTGEVECTDMDSMNGCYRMCIDRMYSVNDCSRISRADLTQFLIVNRA